MKTHHALPIPPRTHRAGFTLTEIVLALAIIATSFIAVLGLLPAGMNASRQAADSTVVAAILENLHNRLQGEPLARPKPGKTGDTNEKWQVSFSPAFFDDHGVFIPADASSADKARRLYRAEVHMCTWKSKPASTGSLRPINIELSWPVDAKTEKALGKDNPKTVVTYTATALTGTDWTAIDTSYVPKIEY